MSISGDPVRGLCVVIAQRGSREMSINLRESPICMERPSHSSSSCAELPDRRKVGLNLRASTGLTVSGRARGIRREDSERIEIGYSS